VRRFVSEDELASRDAQPLVVRCLHCPDWSVEAPAGEARERARAHRAAEHPELPLVALAPKRPKKQPAYEQTAADRKLVGDLAARRRTMGDVSRSRLTDEHLSEAVSRYDQGVSVREIAGDRFEDWGYSSVESLAVALYRLLPQRVAHWRGRSSSRRSSSNGSGRLSSEREGVLRHLYEAHWSLGQIAFLVSETWGYASVDAARAELGKRLRAAGVEVRARTALEQLPEISKAQAESLLAAAEGKPSGRAPVFESAREVELGFRGVALEAG
jgi:hypothetical protein